MSEEKKITTEYFTDITPCSVKSHKQAGPFFLGRLLGKGATGSVRIGTHVETGFQAALKIVKKKYLEDPQNWRLFRREVAIMKMIDHPNIVKLYDVLEADKEIYLVTELVTGGELFDYIPRGGLPHDEILRILSQIIRALLHCHKFGIVHRDLKPENIILDQEKNVKLGDFGMARLMKKGVLLKTSCGSPHYASPEVLKGGEYDGKISDVWSLGVMLYAMCTFSLPFDAEHIRTLFKKIQRGVYRTPTSVRPEMADLIKQMLQVDTKERIKMDEIQYHAVFAKTEYFTAPLRPSASLNVLTFSKKMLDQEIGESLLELDEAALEDLNQLSLGWKSKEELARAILQEGSKEKFMYNLMICRKKQRFEELTKKSPSRRNSLSESAPDKYPASPFVDSSSPSSKTRTLAATTSSPATKARTLGIDTTKATGSPASKTRTLGLDSPSTKTRTMPSTSTTTTGSPSSKTRSIVTESPTSKSRTIEKKAGDVKEVDSPRAESDDGGVDLTEDLLAKAAIHGGDDKFKQIEVKMPLDSSGRRGSTDSTETDSVAGDETVGTEDPSQSDEEDSGESTDPQSPLYDAPPAVVGLAEGKTTDGKDKEEEFDTLKEKIAHQEKIAHHHKHPKKPESTATTETTTGSTGSTATTSTTTTGATNPDIAAAALSFSKSFRQSRRLFPAYHYKPTKEEETQKEALLKSQSAAQDKGFSANVTAIWSFLSSAFKRRKAGKQKRSSKVTTDPVK